MINHGEYGAKKDLFHFLMINHGEHGDSKDFFVLETTTLMLLANSVVNPVMK